MGYAQALHGTNRPVHVRALPQCRWRKHGPTQVGTPKVGSTEVDPSEIRIPEICALKMSML